MDSVQGSRPIIIKKSPVAIVKNFIVLEVIALAGYLITGTLAHYARIYRSLPISKILSFQIAQALFVFGVEMALVFYIFFRWYKEYIQIRPDQIIHGWGLFYRHRRMIPLEHISSVDFRQSPLGKLVKYGTVDLKDSLMNQTIRLKDIPEPGDFVDLVLKLKHSGEDRLKTKQPNISELIAAGEHENAEFKSTFRWDVREGKINRNLEKSVMKTIAALLNTSGGHVVVGVNDTGQVVGLESDYVTLGKQNADGFENHFSHVFHNMIGAEFRHLIRLSWQPLEGKECCVVTIAPSQKPAYLRSDDHEEFYIRTGNGTTSLKFSEAAAYINSHFGGHPV